MLGKLERAVEAVMDLIDLYPECDWSLGGIKKALPNTLRPFFEAPVEVDLDLENHPDALTEELWQSYADTHFTTKARIRETVERHFKALAAELQPAPRSLDDLIEAICGSAEEERTGSHIYCDDLEKILRHHIRALPAPRVSDETIKTLAVDLETALPAASGDDRNRQLDFRMILRRHLQPKPKSRVWPKLATDGYPNDWKRVEEWVPRDGDRVLMAGESPSGKAVWCGHSPDLDATHWCRLKKGPSA